MKQNEQTLSPEAREKRERKLRTMEGLATLGLLLLAVGLVAPFAGLTTPGWLTAFKWIYTVGAAAYFIARVVASTAKGESLRPRRLRRMESWAGLAFCIGAFFWFWNTRGFHGMPTFHMLNETIIFTLAGAVIQIVASWMLSSALRKDQREISEKQREKGDRK